MQTWTAARRRSVLGVGAAVLVTWACGTGSTSSSGADAGTGANGDGGSSVVDSGTVDSGTAAVVCTGATQLEIIVCQANAFLATLSDTERAEVNLDFSNATAKTYWSNLPGLTRAGVKMGNLSASSQAAALALMSTALTEAGMSNVTGIRAADDYLNSVQSTGSGGDGGAGGGGMGGPPDGGGMGGGPTDGGGGPTGGGGGTAGGYGSGNYSIAIFGTPSTTGNWELTFGGHHMAYNLNFIGGVGYPVPNHLGVEPKFAFTFDGGTYQPLEDEGDAFFNVFTSMSSTELTDTHISGTFSDVVMGPVEYGTGSYANVTAAYPTGASNRGVFASTLNATSKAAVIGAIKAWVQQFHASYSDDLVAAYTSDEALAQTYVAWGGNESLTSGPDRDEDKTYLRIDGPRIWLELACQQGVVIPAYTHFHTIYRDKQFDYGGEL